jgi:hypothetical protein
MTPKLVSLKYSNGRDLWTVFKNGYKYNGRWELKNKDRVSAWEAMHWSRAKALQTRLDAWAVKVAGDNKG